MGFLVPLCNIFTITCQFVRWAKLFKALPAGEHNVVEMWGLEQNEVTGTNRLVQVNRNSRAPVRLIKVPFERVNTSKKQEYWNISQCSRGYRALVYPFGSKYHWATHKQVNWFLGWYVTHSWIATSRVWESNSILLMCLCQEQPWSGTINVGQLSIISGPEQPHQFFKGHIISPTHKGVKWTDS